jgi:hypothetical protein
LNKTLEQFEEESENNISEWRQKYAHNLDCRKSFTQLSKGIAFFWEDAKIDVVILFAENASLKLNEEEIWFARSFLHGVSKFALRPLSDKPLAVSVEGYKLKHPLEDDAIPQTPPIKTATTSVTDHPQYLDPPLNSLVDAKVACRLVPTFHESFNIFRNRHKEYLEQHGVCLSDDFELLFLCKNDDGWFWAFTKEQHDFLAKCYDSNNPGKAEQFNEALSNFRFSRTGIINHMERTELLTEEVFDFTKEPYSCITGGYYIEDTSKFAETFEDIERLFPMRDKSPFFYARIASHPGKPRETIQEGIQQKLAPGSLVAVFRSPETVAKSPELRTMFVVMMHALVQQWRAQAAGIGSVGDAVRQVEEEKRSEIQKFELATAGFDHMIFGNAREAISILKAIDFARRQPRSADGVNRDIAKTDPDARFEFAIKIARSFIVMIQQKGDELHSMMDEVPISTEYKLDDIWNYTWPIVTGFRRADSKDLEIIYGINTDKETSVGGAFYTAALNILSNARQHGKPPFKIWTFVDGSQFNSVFANGADPPQAERGGAVGLRLVRKILGIVKGELTCLDKKGFYASCSDPPEQMMECRTFYVVRMPLQQ